MRSLQIHGAVVASLALAACYSGGPRPGAPDAPALSVTVSDGAAMLRWTVPAGATTFELYSGTAPGITPASGTLVATADAKQDSASGSVSKTVAGLAAGSTTYFVVRAINSTGPSKVSNEVSATMAPAAATGLTVEAGDQAAVVRWAEAAGATSYNVYYATGATVSPATGVRVPLAPGGTVTGLASGATYAFVVAAVNAGGEGQPSSVVSATLVPAPPQGLALVPGPGQLTATWATSPGATAYDLDYATAPGVTPAGGTRVAQVQSGVVLSGLADGSTYYVIVTAHNASGDSAPSAEASTTLAPAAPTGVSAVPGDGQAAVSWTAPPGATSYNVYYAPGSTSPTSPRVTVTGTTATLPNLTNGTVYAVAVAAVNDAGEGAASSPACVLPTSDPTAGLQLYDGLCGSTLDGQRWMSPQSSRRIAAGKAALSVQLDNAQSRTAQGLTYQTLLQVGAVPAGGRVTALQADVAVPAATASRTGAATVMASLRLVYQPAAQRGLSFPGANLDNLLAVLELVDTGSGLQLRRQFFHCDDARCSTLSASGIATSDPTGFAVSASVPSAATAQAAYDTTYTLSLSLDESSHVFSWTVSGGTLAAPETGTADVSGWLATAGLGMDLSSASTGFAAAQLLARALDGSSTGGSSAKVTANFSNVRVGLNGAAPTLYDDFSTLGSSAATGFNPALWTNNSAGDASAVLANGSLHLHGDLATPTTTTATQRVLTSVSAMYPAAYRAWQVDLTITAAQVPAPSGSFDNLVLQGSFYNDGTPGGGASNATGDIRANLVLSPAAANFNIQRCTNANCSQSVFLTSAPSNAFTPSAAHPLGIGTTHRLYEKWDPALHLFTFQLDDATPIMVDPTSASDPHMTGGTAQVANTAPFVPAADVHTTVSISAGQASAGSIDATVNNLFVAP